MITVDIRKADKVVGAYSMFLSFPYDENVLGIVKTLSPRFWHNSEKEWELPVSKLTDIVNQLTNYEIQILGNLDALKERKSPNIDFKFKTKPFDHQIDGFNYGLTHDTWLLGDEQGCISGECKVKIKEIGKPATRNIKLKYLYEQFKTDKTAQIKSLVNGRFAYMPIKAVVYKGVQETIKITLEDTAIVCTPDHLIYTQSGWVRADSLKVDDLVFTNGKEVCPICGTDKNLVTYPYSKFLGYCKKCMYASRNGNRYKDADIVKVIDRWGYVRLFGKATRKMPNYDKLGHTGGIYEHHQVWYENTGHIVDTSKEVVHHKNGIKTDNRFENLELMSISEHCKKHSDRKTSHLYQFNENLDFVMRGKTKIYLVPQLQKVSKIEPQEAQDVYDVEVDSEDIHNFICNNIVVHNCGKTWQVINIALAKKQLCEYKHCLIVCGVNGLKYNWFNEIAKHSNEQGHILGWKQRKDGKGMLKNISNANKLADIQRIDELPYFIITNVESLRDEKIANELKVLCSEGTIGMVAIDEIHRCKDASSQQGKGILKLKAKDMIAMTGTPLLNTPLDLYIILKWLGYETHSFYAFKNHYCIMGGYGGYQIMGYQNKDELRETLSEMMLRRLKEDVLDLPEKLYVDEYVEMSKEQWSIYDEILSDLRHNVDKIAESPNPLSQLIRLRQATGYTGILSTEIAVSAKLDRMEELVEDAVANGRKVIVYSNWTDMTDVVLERLKAYNPATITGKVNSSDVPLMEKKFQEDDSCKVIVGTISKMGTGYTLNSGTVEIFLDLPWTMGAYQQAVDRAHRIGQNSNITIYNLLCKDTIDERIWNIVKGKGELSDAIIDGKTVNDRRELLNYLLN